MEFKLIKNDLDNSEKHEIEVKEFISKENVIPSDISTVINSASDKNSTDDIIITTIIYKIY
jgi:hypothetical protein